MTVHKVNPASNTFKRYARKIYNPLGFTKAYNFILFFIFAGTLFGFCLARTNYLNVNGIFLHDAAPGEKYWYSQDWYNIGIHIHLTTCIPAGILVVWQFVPVIRYKALLFHRVNGYICSLLLIVTNVGALMIARRAFGGTLPTQAAVGVLAIVTTGSSVMAYINIKRLQIEQHRAWMLRAWTYMGGIITTRLLQSIATPILSKIGGYYMAMPCRQIVDSGGLAKSYASCLADPNSWAVVHADYSKTTMGVEEVAAVFQVSFGMCVWLAFFLHAVGIEIYLHLTKAEGERLRQVSYERQLERGMKNPGSAGLTCDRFGDEEDWKPATTTPVGEMREEVKTSGLTSVVSESESSSTRGAM